MTGFRRSHSNMNWLLFAAILPVVALLAAAPMSAQSVANLPAKPSDYVSDFAHNGGLFDTASIIQLDKADLGILHEVTKNYYWPQVAPAIFGTLFERSLDPARRSVIGAHYTSEEDIHR